ncbi:MAG: GNAT family N-acetyltransferase [Anaerolineales bacterium]|nr:GNAT family N-acetyltransferase [Anaerolineales bacterium]
MEFQRDGFRITDDKTVADVDYIVAALHTTYWAADRPREIIEAALENSVLLSLFDGAQQVGFVRVVTDYITFAWICDVYVDPEARGQGLGVWMMECLAAHPATQVGLQLLATRDAQGLYEKFGFQRWECMSKRRAY